MLISLLLFVRNFFDVAMKAKLVPLVLVLMAAAFVYVRFTAFRPRLTELRVGNTVIKVDVADTVGKQRQGLSGRKLLAPDRGMYFPMGIASGHTFWMKDMKFPLDIIWIRAGRIVDISENVPYPVGDAQPISVRPKEPADAVLEVNADFTEKHGVKIGDNVAVEK